MIRSIRYKITEDIKGIEPKTKQWAGMQYEDNATDIVFDLSKVFERVGISAARIDFNSAAAGYHPSENLDFGSGEIRRTIPKYITQYGGELQITAVITLVDPTNESKPSVCLSYPVEVYFTPVEKSENGNTDVEGNISEMENAVREMAASVESNLQTTDDYRRETELYYREAKGLHDSIIAADVTAERLTETKQEAEELINTVEQKLANGDFNGKDGKDGKDGANGKDAITDQTYSPTSENAQSGKAVAEALATIGGGGTKLLKLIKTITIEEDITDVNVNFDKGLKEIVVIMNVAFDEDVTKAICCRSDGGQWYWFYDTITLKTTKRFFYAHTKEIFERHWESIMPASLDGETLWSNGNINAKYSLKIRNQLCSRYVKDLNFFVAGRANKFMAGSTIEIWGAEA